jgi:hypothetical protein
LSFAEPRAAKSTLQVNVNPSFSILPRVFKSPIAKLSRRVSAVPIFPATSSLALIESGRAAE